MIRLKAHRFLFFFAQKNTVTLLLLCLILLVFFYSYKKSIARFNLKIFLIYLPPTFRPFIIIQGLSQVLIQERLYLCFRRLHYYIGQLEHYIEQLQRDFCQNGISNISLGSFTYQFRSNKLCCLNCGAGGKKQQRYSKQDEGNNFLV